MLVLMILMYAIVACLVLAVPTLIAWFLIRYNNTLRRRSFYEFHSMLEELFIKYKND